MSVSFGISSVIMWAALVQNILFPAHEALMGRQTLSVLRDLQRNAALNDEHIAEYHARHVSSLLEHARAASPYWRTKLHDCCEQQAPRPGFVPGTSHHALTTEALPILTRAEIRRHRETMRCEGHGKLIIHSSSGTTDDNLVFYLDGERQAWDRASRIHALARLGVSLGDKQLHFMPQFGSGGRLGALKDAARLVRDRLTRDPAFDLHPRTSARLDAALAFFRRYRPAVIVGYPSGLFALAQHCLNTRSEIPVPTLRYVLSTGELLYDFQRKLIETTFGARVVEEYGSQEVGVIASEDAAGQWLVNWPHLIVEIMRGGRPAYPGELGEVVITTLHSRAMPFLRYATGDVARTPITASVRISAGLKALPPIEGRTSDLAVTTDGRLYSNRELVDTLVRETGVTEFSLHQTSADRMLCMTLRERGWVGQEAKVTELLRSMLGRSLQVDWKIGAAFQPLKSGKRRYVCSPVAQMLLAHDRESGMFLSRAWPQRVLDAA
jgi:phenylacetate-CoA ligase